MIELAIGIAIGAAFSPFWIKLYGWGKVLISEFMTTTPPPPPAPPAA